jgi:hypothetical protein
MRLKPLIWLSNPGKLVQYCVSSCVDVQSGELTTALLVAPPRWDGSHGGPPVFLEDGIDLSGTRRGADLLVNAKLPAAAKTKTRDATTMISFLCVMRITPSHVGVMSYH